MNWTVVGPLIGGLVGALIGATGTVAGQYVGALKNSAASKAGHRLTLRADRRDAVYQFLEVAQAAEKIAESRYEGNGFDENEARAAMHQVWYRQKCVEVIGSRQLLDACVGYSWRLHHATWAPPSDGTSIWDFMTGPRNEFLQAAKVELDAGDLAQRRRIALPWRKGN